MEMSKPVTDYAHVLSTWEVYPRANYFQTRFQDLYKRYKKITIDGPHSSLFKNLKQTGPLEEWILLLENNLRVIVIGRDDLETEFFVASNEPLIRALSTDLSIQDSPNLEQKDPRSTIVICHAIINDFDSDGLKEVSETLEYFKSMEKKMDICLIASPLIVCQTRAVHQGDVTLSNHFRSDMISTAAKIFDLRFEARDVIMNPDETALSSKISEILEKRIMQGFVDVSTQIQDFISDRFVAAGVVEILESEQLINAIQGFLRNGLVFVDMLETRKNEPFIDLVLSNLARVIRCAVMEPLSVKYSLSLDACNRTAQAYNFEDDVIRSVSKNTRYHLSKLEKPSEEMLKAAKSGNMRYHFPGRNFVFIAYPLREDIKKAFGQFEEKMNSVRRTASMMRKMLFEISGYQRGHVANPEAIQKQTKIPDELRKRIVALDGVFGMGTIYGQVEIHLMKTEKDKKLAVQTEVSEVMGEFKFLHPYRMVTVLQKPYNLFAFSAGRRIKSQDPHDGNYRRGTLGCFVCSDTNQLFGLTCAHVVHGNGNEHDVFIESENEELCLFGRSLPRMTIIPASLHISFIDIAAVEVKKECLSECVPYLKDENGKEKRAELFTDSPDTIVEQFVYKYGASSKLTKGIVCSTDYSLFGANSRDLIVLIDSLPGNDGSYAQKGDSGAINCMSDVRNNGTIKAVSMINCGGCILEDHENEFCLSFLLQNGIERLQESAGINLALTGSLI